MRVARAVDLNDADALDALRVGEAGVEEDVGGLAGPRRLRADAGSDEDCGIGQRGVGELEQIGKALVIERAGGSNEVEKVGVGAGNGGVDGAKAGGEALGFKGCQRRRPCQREEPHSILRDGRIGFG